MSNKILLVLLIVFVCILSLSGLGILVYEFVKGPSTVTSGGTSVGNPCSATSDCNSGLICYPAANGQSACLVETGKTNHTCLNDTDCTSNGFCVNSYCVATKCTPGIIYCPSNGGQCDAGLTANASDTCLGTGGNQCAAATDCASNVCNTETGVCENFLGPLDVCSTDTGFSGVCKYNQFGKCITVGSTGYCFDATIGYNSPGSYCNIDEDINCSNGYVCSGNPQNGFSTCVANHNNVPFAGSASSQSQETSANCSIGLFSVQTGTTRGTVCLGQPELAPGVSPIVSNSQKINIYNPNLPTSVCTTCPPGYVCSPFGCNLARTKGPCANGDVIFDNLKGTTGVCKNIPGSLAVYYFDDNGDNNNEQLSTGNTATNGWVLFSSLAASVTTLASINKVTSTTNGQMIAKGDTIGIYGQDSNGGNVFITIDLTNSSPTANTSTDQIGIFSGTDGTVHPVSYGTNSMQQGLQFGRENPNEVISIQNYTNGTFTFDPFSYLQTVQNYNPENLNLQRSAVGSDYDVSVWPFSGNDGSVARYLAYVNNLGTVSDQVRSTITVLNMQDQTSQIQTSVFNPGLHITSIQYWGTGPFDFAVLSNWEPLSGIGVTGFVGIMVMTSSIVPSGINEYQSLPYLGDYSANDYNAANSASLADVWLLQYGWIGSNKIPGLDPNVTQPVPGIYYPNTASQSLYYDKTWFVVYPPFYGHKDVTYPSMSVYYDNKASNVSCTNNANDARMKIAVLVYYVGTDNVPIRKIVVWDSNMNDGLPCNKFTQNQNTNNYWYEIPGNFDDVSSIRYINGILYLVTWTQKT